MITTKYERRGRLALRLRVDPPKDPLIEAIKEAQAWEGYLNIFRRDLIIVKR